VQTKIFIERRRINKGTQIIACNITQAAC